MIISVLTIIFTKCCPACCCGCACCKCCVPKRPQTPQVGFSLVAEKRKRVAFIASLVICGLIIILPLILGLVAMKKTRLDEWDFPPHLILFLFIFPIAFALVCAFELLIRHMYESRKKYFDDLEKCSELKVHDTGKSYIRLHTPIEDK